MFRSLLGAVLLVILVVASTPSANSADAAERVWRVGWFDLIFPDFVVGKYGDEIGQFITTNHLPAMTQLRGLLERGALLYYYTDVLALRRRAATYVDKIVKGARPADLPVEQPSRFRVHHQFAGSERPRTDDPARADGVRRRADRVTMRWGCLLLDA